MSSIPQGNTDLDILLENEQFDATEGDTNFGFEPLPEGWYKVIVAATDTKESQRTAGAMNLQLKLEVVDGQHTGRLHTEHLPLKHPKPEAVKMARAKFTAFCRATGVLKPRDSYELVGKPFWIYLRLKKDRNNGEMQNEIKSGTILSLADGEEARKKPVGVAAPGARTAGGPAPIGPTPVTAAAPAATAATAAPAATGTPRARSWKQPQA